MSASSLGSQIPRRPLGRTGLEVSVIGFGASPLGNVFEEVDHDAAVDAVRAAYESGINVFDTSPYYGLTRSEMVLGQALKEAAIPRDKIILASKVGRYGANEFDFSAQRVKYSVQESLQRLQTDYLDIVQVHDMEFGDLDQIVRETLPALNELKEEGLVRHIGITGLPLGCFQYILDRCPSGTLDVILSYCHFTLNDDSLLGLIPYLEKKGVGIINASVLSMGLLTPQGPPSWHPAPSALKTAAREAVGAAKARNMSLPTIAIAEAVRDPRVACHLIGASSRQQVEEAIEAAILSLGTPNKSLPPGYRETLDEVEKILEPVKNLSWPSGAWKADH